MATFPNSQTYENVKYMRVTNDNFLSLFVPSLILWSNILISAIRVFVFFFFHLWSVGPLLLNVQCVIRFWPSNSFICIWNDCDGEIGCLLGQFPAKDSSIKGQFPTAPKISNHPMNWSLSRSMYGEIKNEKMKIGRPFGAGLASLFSLYIHIWSHS